KDEFRPGLSLTAPRNSRTLGAGMPLLREEVLPMRRWVRLSGTILSVLLVESLSAEAAPWHDPSPHTVRVVTVADGVRLEVLDWGGSGRPVVLIAGGGNTAHVFDDFRSEEHTSELQSRSDLVCRLLLEKKK